LALQCLFGFNISYTRHKIGSDLVENRRHAIPHPSITAFAGFISAPWPLRCPNTAHLTPKDARMITVYHLNRSRSLRVLWLLEELGLDYEVARFERDAKTNLAPAELLDIHPLGKSPMLRMDGDLIIESGAIIECICARHAPDMIPPTGTPAHIRHLECMHFAEGSAMTPILLNLYVGRLGEAGAPLHPRITCLLYTSPSPRDRTRSRLPSSA